MMLEHFRQPAPTIFRPRCAGGNRQERLVGYNQLRICQYIDCRSRTSQRLEED